MSRFLNHIIRGALAALALSAPASAAGQSDLSMTFAKCTGRLSALMEFQWLVGEDASQTTRERAAMISLLEASLPRSAARVALARRIEAKQAHARLLQRAAFSDNPREARWAKTRAEVELGHCRSLILS